MSIGESLAAARRERGLSIEQVSAATRIRAPIVAAMEADDFAPCGGDFYARANVRNVAAVVGLDPEPLLAQLDASRTGAGAPSPRLVFDAEVRTGGPRRRGPNWSAAMLVALVLVIGYGLAQAVFTSSDAPSDDPVAVAPPTAEPDAEPSPAPTQSGDDDAVAAAPDRVEVLLRVEGGRSWVSVTGAGDKPLYEGELAEGSTRTFQDDEQVKIVVGNAGAVRLVVNGEDIGAPGEPGEVVRLTFRPGDPDSPEA